MAEFVIDVIILSYSKNNSLRKTTEQALSTLFSSESRHKVKFNAIVVESNEALQPYQYPNTTTIYTKQKFGYNKYMNIGIKQSNSPYVCLCNNDLIFHKNWASEILNVFSENTEVMSASPICSLIKDKEYIEVNSGNHYGYAIRKHISGWCIFIKRELIKNTGYFDEKFKFWYADNDYANTLKVNCLKHVLVSSSIVDHLESVTLNKSNKMQKYILTNGEFIYFDFKWNHKNIFIYMYRLLKFKVSVLIQQLKQKTILSFFKIKC